MGTTYYPYPPTVQQPWDKESLVWLSSLFATFFVIIFLILYLVGRRENDMDPIKAVSANCLLWGTIFFVLFHWGHLQSVGISIMLVSIIVVPTLILMAFFFIKDFVIPHE